MKPPLSQDSLKPATQKLFRSSVVIATKRIAYAELMHPENNMSQRKACKLIRVSRSTFQRWMQRPAPAHCDSLKEHEFFCSPEGIICLHRIILAAAQTIRYGSKGIRGIQEFLVLSKLDSWAASSTGALHGWVGKIEATIVQFGHEQRDKLSQGMVRKKISICQDENFHEDEPCLVTIEPVSNFILVEKITEERSKNEWTKAVDEGLYGLNVEIIQSTSDEGTAIIAHVKQELKAEHSPDLFHIQQELSRATSFALKSQEKEFEKASEIAEEKLKKAIARHGENSVQAQEAKGMYNLKQKGLTDRTKRRQDVREAKRSLGESYHPVNIETGKLESVEKIESQLNMHIGIIEEKCREAELSESSLKRMLKAKGMISAMVAYLRFFFMMLKGVVESLGMKEEEAIFFQEMLVPLAYLEEAIRKQPTRRRKKMIVLLEELSRKARAGPWTGKDLEDKKAAAKEIARVFQRSSSCVEGRNGVLALKHHSFHKISPQTLAVLTIIHNYHIEREDGTTAAERFFGNKPDDLFEYILDKVPMLGRPRTRQLGEREREVAA
jgi:hypothetical protein